MKFFNISNTVAKTGIAASGLGVKMFNVHTLGGLDMIDALRKAIR